MQKNGIRGFIISVYLLKSKAIKVENVFAKNLAGYVNIGATKEMYDSLMEMLVIK